MTGEQYFEHIASIIESRKNLARTIENLRDEATAIGGFDYSRDRVQTTPKNTMEEKVVRLADTIDKYEKTARKYADKVLEAEIRISELSKPEYGKVIRLRYLCGRHTWGWIADEMGYSEDGAKRICKKSLKEFEERWLN